MKYRMIRFGVLSAGVACAAMAAAQTNGPTGFSVRLGVFLPTNTSSDLGTVWFGGGIDYKLNTFTLPAPGVGGSQYFSISADYFENHGARDIPVALNYNFRQSSFVYSVGLGPDFRRLGDDGVGLSGQVGLAYEFGHFPTPLFVQAKYFLTSKPELSGFGLYVGVRF